VTLLFAIARNHPFEQGNKRTAFEAALIFLENNGYGFRAPDDPQLARAITAVISHQSRLQDFEDLIRPLVEPIDPPA
jgi:death on curing protein